MCALSRQTASYWLGCLPNGVPTVRGGVSHHNGCHYLGIDRPALPSRIFCQAPMQHTGSFAGVLFHFQITAKSHLFWIWHCGFFLLAMNFHSLSSEAATSHGKIVVKFCTSDAQLLSSDERQQDAQYSVVDTTCTDQSQHDKP